MPLKRSTQPTLWASCVTGATWSLAGWGLTPGLGPLGQGIAAAVGFALGCSMVLTFDNLA